MFKIFIGKNVNIIKNNIWKIFLRIYYSFEFAESSVRLLLYRRFLGKKRWWEGGGEGLENLLVFGSFRDELYLEVGV